METKLNPERARLWIEALRSHRYKQGYGRLRINHTDFCCLGVMCDVARENGCLGDWNEHYEFISPPAQARRGTPPPVVLEWFGSNPSEPPDITFRRDWLALHLDPDVLAKPEFKDCRSIGLTRLNDSRRVSFDDIANLIEKGLEEQEAAA